ncbi:MAG TPA: nuclease-related domain-containing protein [Mariprofundaceae bacterium]|nr:nuclease-related domain-containing protein [Mariprofundaceae bacterium]
MPLMLNDPMIPLALTGIALLLLFLSGWLAWPWMMASLQQSRIRHILSGFEHEGAVALHDVMLADRKGETVWIDHLLVSKRGLLAVQVLAFNGQILGSLRDALWTIENNLGRHRFPNPLRQTAQAEEVIANILGSKFTVQTAIIPAGGSITGSMPAQVIPAGRLRDFILAESEKNLSESRIRWLSNTISQVLIDDPAQKQKHMEEVMARLGDRAKLRRAKIIMLASCVLMLAVIAIVGLHYAAWAGEV